MFLSRFNWFNLQLGHNKQQRIEQFLVKYRQLFARNRLHIGINTRHRIEFMPRLDDPIYAQSLPTPSNMKTDILGKVALIQQYGLITTLPFSKYFLPCSAQRNPIGKSRLLVGFKGTNNLTKHDFNEHYHPVTTIADAARHMAGKKCFVSWIFLRLTTAFRWLTISTSDYCRLTPVPHYLSTTAWLKVVTIHFQRLPVLFESTLTLL